MTYVHVKKGVTEPIFNPPSFSYNSPSENVTEKQEKGKQSKGGRKGKFDGATETKSLLIFAATRKDVNQQVRCACWRYYRSNRGSETTCDCPEEQRMSK